MPRGGKRPGAGRKPKAVEEFRLRMQQRFETVLQADVDAMIKAIVARVKVDGDPKAFSAVAPYLFGPPPKELTLRGDPDAPLRIQVRAVDYRSAVAALAPGDADSQEDGQ